MDGADGRLGLKGLVIWILLAASATGFGAQPTAPGMTAAPGRIILIKSDGLPTDLLAAVALPERTDLMERLPYAEDLRAALREYRERTGRDLALPNIRKYFYENGVFFDNFYAHTLTLSAASWGVIDTGQPSVVKGHGTFSRDTCFLRSHLDGLRDTIDALKRRPGYGEIKSSATWKLEQIGLSLLQDAFDPLRTWSGPQIFRRMSDRELLLAGGIEWLKAGGQGFGSIARGHLARRATGIDYSEFNQKMNSRIAAKKVTEHDLMGNDRFDYIGPLFTLMDHQQHVDPHPANLLFYLTLLDNGIGDIFQAVEASQIKDRTVVALVSDHGSEIQPGKTGFSFQLTREFREPLLGAHNVKTLLVENAFSAVSTPLPGYDWPRLYHSRFSPYNRDSKGFATAYVDPFGNGRAAVYLRNNDLNRLHLLLLELKKKPDGGRFAKLKSLFRQTLEQTRTWLEEDVRLYEDYLFGALDLAANLQKKADRRSHDTAARLAEEIKRDRPQIRSLRRLLDLRFEPDNDGLFFDSVFGQGFEIEDYIPKQYLGKVNTTHQLSHYTMGLTDELNWMETTEDHQGRLVPMDYFEILTSYRASNAPVNGLFNPFDFVVKSMQPGPVEKVLRSRGLIGGGDRLRNVAWIKSSHTDHPEKGGEALALQSVDDRVLYLPVRGLEQTSDGEVVFHTDTDRDPLGLLRSPRVQVPSGPVRKWLTSFHPGREWLPVIHGTEYSIGVLIILDLINHEADRFIENPEFQKYLIHFSAEEYKKRYLRGLGRKYRNQYPDFIVWADELWNFNSKARTSGGNHSGLRPVVTRTAFLVWGGERTGVARGVTVKDVHTTIDIAPTLFEAIGMLDRENRVIQSAGTDYRRVFLPFPGVPVDLSGAGLDTEFTLGPERVVEAIVPRKRNGQEYRNPER